MKLLVTLCLMGVALASPSPGFRYAYMIPQADQQERSSLLQPWSQFQERSDDNYAWGYEYPGRAHFESKDNGGVVRGSFGFVDANGSPNVWKYISNPRTGFEVDIGTGEAIPQAPSPSSGDSVAPPSTDNEDIPSFRAQVQNSLSPLLKSAAESGQLVSAGLSLSGTPQFAVNPDTANEAGSVSALAQRFNAIPVAAVHDVQSRPSFGIPDSAFAPVLVHQEEPEFTLYTLELPTP